MQITTTCPDCNETWTNDVSMSGGGIHPDEWSRIKLQQHWSSCRGTAERRAALDSVYPEWRRASHYDLLQWLANETADVLVITAEVSKAYCNLTGGKISKPNTLAHLVIAEVEEYFQTMFEED